MKSQVYRQMVDVMIKRGGAYTGMDIPEFYDLVEELFSPEEAEVNNALSRKPVTAADLALQTGRDEEPLAALLEKMAEKGLCCAMLLDGKRHYQGAPFMPGIFEYIFMGGGVTERHKKIAGLISSYKGAFIAARGHQQITFPLSRVIPVDRKIGVHNTIHTYDQMMTYINKSDPICVGSCFCRHSAMLKGEDIHGMPTEVCMWFGKTGEFAIEKLGGRKVSKEEARKILDVTEEAGLVHMSRNTTEDVEFVCNCDRWHCEVVKSVLKNPRPGSVFNSGFQPQFDPERCVACETCVERCPPGALRMGENDLPVVDLNRCFGCAVCATGCQQEAIVMETKLNFPEPPRTIKDLVAAVKASASHDKRSG